MKLCKISWRRPPTSKRLQVERMAASLMMPLLWATSSFAAFTQSACLMASFSRTSTAAWWMERPMTCTSSGALAGEAFAAAAA